MPISRQNERNLAESAVVEGDQSKEDVQKMIAVQMAKMASKVSYARLELLLTHLRFDCCV